MDEAGATRHFESHLEMQGLALIDEIQRAIGMQDLAAVTHGRQVGGGVEVAAAGLLHDHRERIAFGVLEFVEEDALRAVVLSEQTFTAQGFDDICKLGVVGALPLDVGRGQLDVEAVVDLLAVRQGNIVEARPQAQALCVPGLKLYHQFAGAVGELGGLVEALFRCAIELLQVGQLAFRRRRFFLEVSQQHAELGAPVADVVLPDHLVAEVLEHTTDGVTNNGRAQVANMHLFRQVWR